jgi:hypothetical protein
VGAENDQRTEMNGKGNGQEVGDQGEVGGHGAVLFIMDETWALQCAVCRVLRVGAMIRRVL